MLKQNIKVTLHLDCSADIVFDDAVLYGAGKTAYDQLGHDIRIVGYNSKDYFIREGAVCYAEIEKSTSEVAVADDVCPVEGESE